MPRLTGVGAPPFPTSPSSKRSRGDTPRPWSGAEAPVPPYGLPPPSPSLDAIRLLCRGYTSRSPIIVATDDSRLLKVEDIALHATLHRHRPGVARHLISHRIEAIVIVVGVVVEGDEP